MFLAYILLNCLQFFVKNIKKVLKPQYLSINQEKSMILNRQHSILVHLEELVHSMRFGPICWLPVHVLVRIQIHFSVACKKCVTRIMLNIKSTDLPSSSPWIWWFPLRWIEASPSKWTAVIFILLPSKINKKNATRQF